MAQSLKTGERHILIEGGTDARYLSSGHLVYARASTLFAVPFDPARLAITGGAFAVVEEVVTTAVSSGADAGGAQFTVSDTGSLVYVPVRAVGGRRLVWVDRGGNPIALTERAAFYQRPRLSPDGKRLALQIEEGGKYDIWIYEIDRDDFSRLTTQGNNRGPFWSPDAKSVAFTSDRDGDGEIYRKPGDFSDEANERRTQSERAVGSKSRALSVWQRR